MQLWDNAQVARKLVREGFGVMVLGVMLLFGNPAVPVNAQSGTTIVISPASSNIALTFVGSVDVVINDYNDPNPVGPNGQGLYGADIRLSFDRTKVTVQDDNPFQSGVQVFPGPLLASGTFLNLINSADNTAGTIQFVITQLAPTSPQVCPTPPTACTGVLFTIHFIGNALGSSPVHFTYEKLSNPNGLEIFGSTTDGVVNVTQPTASIVTDFSGTALGPNQAKLEWETGTELGLVGFNLWRSEQAATGYTKRNPTLLPAKSPGQNKSNHYEFQDPALAPNTVYYYKLEALASSNSSIWTEPISVSTPGGCAGKPGKITLLAPANGATVEARVKLDWEDTLCATAYRFQLRRDTPQGSQVKSKVIALSRKRMTLSNGGTYVWRVRGLGAHGRGRWSKWRVLTVK